MAEPEHGQSSPIAVAEEVTVVLVTSYTGACPSTALIEATLSSFAFVPGLEEARTVICADGYVLSSRKRTKVGRLTEEEVQPYELYIDALRHLIARAGADALSSNHAPHEPEPPRQLPKALRRAVLLPLDGHHGFGWAVKAAIESGLVQTRHILVVQHDRCFMRPFDLARVRLTGTERHATCEWRACSLFAVPMRALCSSPNMTCVWFRPRATWRLSRTSQAVGCMREEPSVRYILVPTRSTRNHAQTVAGKCGAKLPILTVNGARLQQLAFWWDSTHLATVDHYLRFVLTERCVKRGTFPEDTLGNQLLTEVKAHGVAAADRYHAWLWAEPPDDGGGDGGVVGHLNGAHWRAWTGAEAGECVGADGAVIHNSRAHQWERAMATMDAAPSSAASANSVAAGEAGEAGDLASADGMATSTEPSVTERELAGASALEHVSAGPGGMETAEGACSLCDATTRSPCSTAPFTAASASDASQTVRVRLRLYLERNAACTSSPSDVRVALATAVDLTHATRAPLMTVRAHPLARAGIACVDSLASPPPLARAPLSALPLRCDAP